MSKKLSFIFILLTFFTFNKVDCQIVDGGTITFTTGDSVLSTCIPKDTGLVIDAILLDNIGENSLWVITALDGNIFDTLSVPTFAVANYSDNYLIWHLSHTIINQTFIGINKNSLLGDFDYSNPLEVNKKTLFPGTLIQTVGDTIIGCAGDDSIDTLIFSSAGQNGSFNKYLVTDEDGTIVSILTDSILIADSIQLSTCFVQHITYESGIETFLKGMPLKSVTGCYRLSNKIKITKTFVNGGYINLDDDRTQITICVGDGQSDAFTPELNNENGSNSKWIAADNNGDILAVLTFNTFNLEGVPPGNCQIYHISFEGNVDNLSVNNNMSTLEGCYNLSNRIDVIRLTGDTEGGTLSTSSPTAICNGDGAVDSLTLSLVENIGDSLVYLVLNPVGDILLISDTSSIEISGLGKSSFLSVYAMSFLDGLDRLAVGINIDKVEGCYSLSNEIIIDVNNVEGGNILFADSSEVTTICSGDFLIDSLNMIIGDTCGLFYTWVIYNNQDSILSSFDIDSLNADVNVNDTTYLLLVASDYILDDTIKSINDITGCANISNSLTIINSNGEVEATEIDIDSIITICVSPNNIDTLFINNTGNIGIQSKLIITDFNDIIQYIFDSTFVELSLLAQGMYKVYNFAAADNINGLNTGNKIVQIRGCYDLSKPITLNLQTVAGGILTSDPSGEQLICFGNDEDEKVRFFTSGIIGDNQLFVITDIAGTILDAGSNNDIVVDKFGLDSIYVWSVLYNGNVNGLELDSLIYNLAGCFDLSEPLLITAFNIEPGYLSFGDSIQQIEYCSVLDTALIEVELVGHNGSQTILAIANENGDIISIQDSFLIDPSNYLESQIFIIAYSGLDTFYLENGIVKSPSPCFVESNFISVINKNPKGGKLFINDTLKIDTLCVTPSNAGFLPITIEGENGIISEFVVVNLKGDTIHIQNNPMIHTDSLQNDTLIIYHLSYFDSILIGDDACFDISDSLLIILNKVDGGTLTYIDSTKAKVACIGEPIRTLLDDEEGFNFTYILLDQDSIIIDFGKASDSLEFFGLDTGSYYIVHLSSIDTSINENHIGQSINTLSGCLSLSNYLPLTLDEGAAELLSLSLLDTDITCDTSIIATYQFSVPDSTDNQVVYVVVDTNGIITAIHNTALFDIDPTQPYDVYILNFRTAPIPFGIDVPFISLRGCYGLSNAIRINAIHNDGGTISFEDGSDYMDFCGVGNVTDSIFVDLLHVGHVKDSWIVVSTDGIIIDTFNQQPVLIQNNGPDSCFIHHLSYFNDKSLPRVDSLLEDLAGCYDISNGILITKSLIEGGEITANGGKELNICTGDQNIDEVELNVSNTSGDGSGWIITDTLGFITTLSTVAPNNFNSLSTGTCILRHVRFQLGNIQGLSLGGSIKDIAGCYDLSDSIRINKIRVDGGELVVKDSLKELSVCVEDGIFEEITPTLSNAEGANMIWMITDAVGQITSLGTPPPFTFEGEPEGQCFIWNVSSADNVSGLEIGEFLPDVAGCFATSNPIRIRKMGGTECVTSARDFDLSTFVVYPNPTLDQLFIQNDSNLKGQYTLININGSMLIKGQLLGKNQELIDIADLKSGVYSLKITNNKKSYVYPVVKM